MGCALAEPGQFAGALLPSAVTGVLDIKTICFDESQDQARLRLCFINDGGGSRGSGV
jgi:hypothetical protein